MTTKYCLYDPKYKRNYHSNYFYSSREKALDDLDREMSYQTRRFEYFKSKNDKKSLDYLKRLIVIPCKIMYVHENN